MRAHADWWWDAAWNPVGGCLPVSPGCTNCVAPPWNGSHTHRNDVHRGVITKKHGRWTFNGEISDLPDGHQSWKFPLVWPGAGHPKLGPGRPSLIFVVDMADLFYEIRPDEIISRVIATVVASPYNHIGQLVTKRTARMVQFLTTLKPRTVDRWQPQIWLACSCENQEWFDRRWPDMRVLAAEGWFIFVSLAPLIGPIILPDDFLRLGSRTWVIVGGEHRVRKPRDMNPRWARALRDQCKVAGIPFFLKQMAGDAPIPEGLRNLRQFPSVPPL